MINEFQKFPKDKKQYDETFEGAFSNPFPEIPLADQAVYEADKTYHYDIAPTPCHRCNCADFKSTRMKKCIGVPDIKKICWRDGCPVIKTIIKEWMTLKGIK